MRQLSTLSPSDCLRSSRDPGAGRYTLTTAGRSLGKAPTHGSLCVGLVRSRYGALVSCCSSHHHSSFVLPSMTGLALAELLLGSTKALLPPMVQRCRP